VWPDGAWRTPLGEVAGRRRARGRPRRRLPRAPPPTARRTSTSTRSSSTSRSSSGCASGRVSRPRGSWPVVVAARREAELLALGDALGEADRRARGRARRGLDRHDPPPARPTWRGRRTSGRWPRSWPSTPPRLLATCERERISMCGVRPTVAGLRAALARGATRAALVALRPLGRGERRPTSASWATRRSSSADVDPRPLGASSRDASGARTQRQEHAHAGREADRAQRRGLGEGEQAERQDRQRAGQRHAHDRRPDVRGARPARVARRGTPPGRRRARAPARATRGAGA
jgi:hypothetical protein